MSQTRFLPSYKVYPEPAHDYDDSCQRITRIASNARNRRAMLRQRGAVIGRWIEEGRIAPYGCDCSHCQAGYDCCGNWFVWRYTLRPVRGGLQLIADLSRNI